MSRNKLCELHPLSRREFILTLSSFAFLPMNARGETASFFPLETREESFNGRKIFYYDDAPFLWRIDSTNGVLAAFDFSTRKPIGSDEGVVYQPTAFQFVDQLNAADDDPPRVYRFYDHIYVIHQELVFSSNAANGVLLEDGRFLQRSTSLLSVEPNAEGRISWKISSNDVLTRISDTRRNAVAVRFLSLNYLPDQRTLQLRFSADDIEDSLFIEPNTGRF